MLRRALGAVRRAAGQQRASCASAAARYLPRGAGYPAARDRAALRLARLGGDRRGGRRRDDRQRRGGARALGRPPRRRSTCTWARPTRSRSSTCDERRALVRAVRGRLVHAAEEGDRDLDRAGARASATCCGVELSFGIVSVTEQVIAYQKKRIADHAVLDLLALDMPEQQLRHPGALVRAARRAAARGVPARRAQGSLHAAEHAPDRGAAADRDVRPLGHRRPVDRRSTSRPGRADDLHLRRPPRRRRHHAARATSASSGWSATRCG